jgi:uncharacterized protein (AIM24 family)
MALILSGTNGLSDVDGSASTPAIRGTDTNTGIFFPGNDRIGFAEGGVQVGEFDASGNFQFNSGYGSTAIAYGCRAWVNFNGTGTVAIRASGNVTSITDNSTGNYTINFTTAMPDVNYAVVVTSDLASDGSVIVANTNDFLTARTTSSVRMGCAQPGVGSKDTTHYQVAVFR